MTVHALTETRRETACSVAALHTERMLREARDKHLEHIAKLETWIKDASAELERQRKAYEATNEALFKVTSL